LWPKENSSFARVNSSIFPLSPLRALDNDVASPSAVSLFAALPFAYAFTMAAVKASEMLFRWSTGNACNLCASHTAPEASFRFCCAGAGRAVMMRVRSEVLVVSEVSTTSICGEVNGMGAPGGVAATDIASNLCAGASPSKLEDSRSKIWPPICALAASRSLAEDCVLG